MQIMMELLNQLLTVINQTIRQRNMKNILTILILLIFGCVEAQNINQLSSQEFENISINGHSLQTIWQTNGEQVSVQNLFGIASSITNSDPTPGSLSLLYVYNGLELSFTSLIPSKGNLSGFEISNPSPTLKVKGIGVNIGENISKLGVVKINITKSGGKNIVFSPINDETIYLVIDFDPITKLITKIKYFVLT